MFAFILWREFRLSIAEIQNFFPKSNCLFASREIAFFDSITSEEIISNFHKIGWSIKVVEIIKELKNEKEFAPESIKLITEKIEYATGKFCYAIAQYWLSSNIFTIWLQIKKELKKENVTNTRLVNKDSNNINAAVYKKEKLVTAWIELNLIKASERTFIGKTIAYQDVDNYSSRDYGKSRDMDIWMLPPKLAQMMINLTWNQGNTIYDPFCWLGTVLIEALNSWYKNVYGSDLNPKMVDASNKNTYLYVENDTKINIFENDSARIEKVNFLKWSANISIVTEWYLGSVMTRWHVTEEKIQEERKKLLSIYSWFFGWLKKLNYKWTIVICFPFWQLNGKYIYFEEIYKLIKESGFKTNKLLPEWIEFSETRSWSLLYHRPNQQVWREIFKLN